MLKQKLLKRELEIIEASIIYSFEIEDKSHFINQLPELRVINREYTGVGFYSDFEVTNSNKYTIPGYDSIIVVSAELKGLKYGADFIVYIKKGLIECLEGVCFAEKWPDDFVVKKFCR